MQTLDSKLCPEMGDRPQPWLASRLLPRSYAPPNRADRDSTTHLDARRLRVGPLQILAAPRPHYAIRRGRPPKESVPAKPTSDPVLAQPEILQQPRHSGRSS